MKPARSYVPRHLHRHVLTFVLLTCAASVAAAETKPHAPHYDFETFRTRMEDPARAQWQKPEAVVEKLQLRRGERVADIGAGTGYFTVLLAHAVGRSGRVYAVDINPQAITYMRHRFQREGLPQVTVVKGTGSDPKLPRRVDLIFVCDTWHHIDNRVAYLRVLRRSLGTRGRVVIVDFKPDADPAIGPPKEMRLAPEHVSEELRQAGFAATVEPDFLPLQYVISAGVGASKATK